MAQALSLSYSFSVDLTDTSAKTSSLRSPESEQARFRILNSFKTHLLFMINDSMQHSRRNPTVRLKAIMESPGLAQETMDNKPKVSRVGDKESDYFKDLRHRFLGFKKDKYLSNLEHYQSLAEAQAPKFMVIACADSRVCPSSILGFQPGEAFVIRNVANLVPPSENGPTETNAALEFAVNSLEVENILVVGHSCCGGIKALMSLQDLNSSSFIRSWMSNAKPAGLITKNAASHLNFDQQCRHCEKESINRSLKNLLTYPWIEERVMRGKLSIHGGYYDFTNCTFEKWTLDYNGSSVVADNACSFKNRESWG
ncbi:hypothetical protein ACS0TY_002912 [Phlomoides rotata]